MPPGFRLPEGWVRDEFRKRFLRRLEKAYEKGELVLRGRCGHLMDPRAFEKLIKKMKTAYWHIYAEPVKGLRDGMSTKEAARATLAYLARYVRGIAIGNDRLEKIENGHIYFWYKDRRRGEKWRLTSLPVLEFIRRFLFHILPTGKRHVRNYGFLSPNRRTECLKILGELFDGALHVQEPEETESGDEPRKEDEDEPDRRCPRCAQGVMLVIQRMDRPSVQDIMLMATHQMRQPKLPFL